MNFDLIVIGSGPGGYRAAVLGALKGMKVAIAEKALWGGCCLNRGCVPKKAWYASAREVWSSLASGERGAEGRLRGDLERAWDYQHRITARIRHGYIDYLARLGIARFEGHARLIHPHGVEVAGQRLEGRHIVIATGSTPAIPPGIPRAPTILTTDDLFERPPPPGRRVALLGSGAVAVELAFILTFLGREVIWCARSPMLRRSPFSAAALKALEEALSASSIHLRVAPIQGILPHPQGVRIALRDLTLEADWLCLATGRRPYTEGLGLEALGIEQDARGFIKRNRALQTTLPHVYAIGDCACPEMTANQALDDARIAIDHILTGEGAKDPLKVPAVLYSALEMARIGLSEAQAEAQGLEPAVGFAAFDTSPCALGEGDTRGFVRLLVDMDSLAFLGGEIVGREAGELIHLLAGGDPLKRVLEGRYNHPARAEELQNALETLASRWHLPIL